MTGSQYNKVSINEIKKTFQLLFDNGYNLHSLVKNNDRIHLSLLERTQDQDISLLDIVMYRYDIEKNYERKDKLLLIISVSSKTLSFEYFYN